MPRAKRPSRERTPPEKRPATMEVKVDLTINAGSHAGNPKPPKQRDWLYIAITVALGLAYIVIALVTA